MRPLFDTNVFISYKAHFTDKDIHGMVLSIVVWYEMAAGVLDRSERKRLRRWYELHNHESRCTLLVPTAFDWKRTAEAVAHIRFQDRQAAHGQTPPRNATKLQNDALIAYTASVKQHRCFVVTDNESDFRQLQTVLKFAFISPREYFAL